MSHLLNLTISRAAAYKGVSRAIIYRCIADGRLPATESESGHLMVKHSDLDALELLVSPTERGKLGGRPTTKKA